MKIYYALVGLLIIGGAVLIVLYGLNPRPIPKIKLSGFTDTDKMVEALTVGLYQDLEYANLLFLGVEADNPAQIKAWKHLIELNHFEELQVKGNEYPMPDEIQSLLSQGKKIAVMMPSVDSSQVLVDNASFHYKKAGLLPLSINFISIPRAREQEKDMLIPCDVAIKDVSGAGKLGCMALQEARMNYRKKVKPGMWAGILNQTGGKDYTFMMSIRPEDEITQK